MVTRPAPDTAQRWGRSIGTLLGIVTWLALGVVLATPGVDSDALLTLRTVSDILYGFVFFFLRVVVGGFVGYGVYVLAYRVMRGRGRTQDGQCGDCGQAVDATMPHCRCGAPQ